MAAIALANGLNATMLRKWVMQAEQSDTAPRASARALAASVADPAFVPLPVQPAAACTDIRIEVLRGSTRVTVSWPAAAAAGCAAWLRDLLR